MKMESKFYLLILPASCQSINRTIADSKILTGIASPLIPQIGY